MTYVSVWCACGGQMRETRKFADVNWYCEACNAGVTVVEAAEKPVTATQCGGRLSSGRRCRAPVPRGPGPGLCDECTTRVAIGWLMQNRVQAARTLTEADRRAGEAAQDELERARATAAGDEAARRREADAVHVVYYVRTGDRTIKIGTTGHLTERMRVFRVANPDNLLTAEPGSYEREHERHGQFTKWRYHRRREDFGDADELLEHIAALRARHGDPWTLGGARPRIATRTGGPR